MDQEMKFWKLILKVVVIKTWRMAEVKKEA